MKKLLAVLLLTTSSVALADPHHGWQRGYGGAYHHNDHHSDWVGPFVGGVLAGAVIYDLSRPKVIVQQPPVYAYPQQPIYQYQDIYDSYCNCYRRVLVQIN